MEIRPRRAKEESHEWKMSGVAGCLGFMRGHRGLRKWRRQRGGSGRRAGTDHGRNDGES